MKKIEKKQRKKLRKNNEKKKISKMDSEERIHLKPISEKEFREIAKGCGTRFPAGS